MASTQTVTTIRAYVRAYFDLDSTDLPDLLIDRWISEGWGKIVRFRPNWPGFVMETVLTITAGTATYAMPFWLPSPPTPQMRDVESIEGPDRKLVMMSKQDAERRFIHNGVPDPAGTPVAYAVSQGYIFLYPTPSLNGSYFIRGQRAAMNPLDLGATVVLDLPHEDAAEMLLNWVLYRTAMREAEDTQAQSFLSTFSEGMQLLAKDETDAPAYFPIVLNSQRAPHVGFDTYLPDRLRYQDGWEG